MVLNRDGVGMVLIFLGVRGDMQSGGAQLTVVVAFHGTNEVAHRVTGAVASTLNVAVL